jgi:class 3 adenylate cyclase/tetratricopeptide (TPR) repeat protein
MTDVQSAVDGATGAMSADAFHNFEAYIPGDRRRALASGIDMPDRVRGAALFADISGFTPLTEALALELGPQRGGEHLTVDLNRVFHALIEELDRYGGDVIYFSGDAITCWIDGDDGARATACGIAMQSRMNDVGEVVTGAGTRYRQALKVAIAVGNARRFVVGDPDIQLVDVLAGRMIDALAAAERSALKGEVILDASAVESLGSRIEIRDRRIDEESGRHFSIVSRIVEDVPHRPPPPPAAELDEEMVRPWLLPVVYERLSTGRGEFLAELRPAFPLFVRFGGIDYDDDDDAIEKLDAFVRHAQRIITASGGNLLHLTLGDKGAYLCAVFGSPVAHENDAARAGAAALELRGLEGFTAATGIQIGIARGRLRSGTYGHARRQAFTCLGDAVNLAARLMARAPSGQIYATEDVYRAAGNVFDWEKLPPIALKGKADRHAVFALIGSRRHAARRQSLMQRAIVGREAELAAMVARLDEAAAGKGSVLGVCADAGVGKSRLIEELVAVARQRDIRVADGECQSFGKNTSYFVWRDIWSLLFGLGRASSKAEQAVLLEQELAQIEPALVRRAPLLATLLDLPIADNALTRTFDAKLRKTSLEGLLVKCLQAQARTTPLMVVLEDCQWLDPLSRDLLVALARALPTLRVLIVLAYRPSANASDGFGMDKLPQFERIELAELDHDRAAALIRAMLGSIDGSEMEPPRALIDLVSAHAQGNPFFIEELVNFITIQGIDSKDERALKTLDLPESLYSLILSRIDNLGESPRRLLKVASIIGRVFRAPMLPAVYPELGSVDEIESSLALVSAADLISVAPEAERTYLFKNVVTQEVAYQSMPFALRSMLHERVGSHIEASEADAIDRNLDLLAHHYWRSENLPKKREYLRRAGDAAQASYANTAAIDYFERLAPLVEQRARIDVLLKLGKVLELVGNWRRAEQVDEEAMALAEELADEHAKASCETALAEVARKQGRFDEAVARLDRAASKFRSLGEEDGLANVLKLVGTVAAQRGDYPKAVESYEASLAIRERAGDKASMGSLLSNLGIVAEYRGEYERSRALHERALVLRTEIGDRWGIGNTMNGIGMVAVLQRHYAEASDWFQKSMLINREVGDSWMVAICHNNLGNATRGLGDYEAARKHYADSLRAYREYDDRWALAFLLEDIGILAALSGDARAALELVSAADTLRDAIGAPRSPSLEEELARTIAAAVTGLSDAERVACTTRGRSLDLAGAVDRALALCEEVDNKT